MPFVTTTTVCVQVNGPPPQSCAASANVMLSVTTATVLVQVNDCNLEDVTHEEAVAALKSTGDVVRLTIAKPTYLPDMSSHEDDPGMCVHVCIMRILHVCAYLFVLSCMWRGGGGNWNPVYRTNDLFN